MNRDALSTCCLLVMAASVASLTKISTAPNVPDFPKVAGFPQLIDGIRPNALTGWFPARL
jgi:hypothetical protein